LAASTVTAVAVQVRRRLRFAAALVKVAKIVSWITAQWIRMARRVEENAVGIAVIICASTLRSVTLSSMGTKLTAIHILSSRKFLAVRF